MELLPQIVYVLTNPAMPGLVKIGKTNQSEVDGRMRQLYGTGVPLPFECAFACQVADATDVEKALHFAFGHFRLNPNREFFKLEPERVIALLKLLEVKDVTNQFEEQLEAETELVDKQSAEHFKSTIRPRMNFRELGIPIGSILVSRNGETEIRVVAEKKVEMNGETCSLTMATRRLMGLPDNYTLQPSPYWTYNGKTIKEIYDDFHSQDEEE